MLDYIGMRGKINIHTNCFGRYFLNKFLIILGVLTHVRSAPSQKPGTADPVVTRDVLPTEESSHTSQLLRGYATSGKQEANAKAIKQTQMGTPNSHELSEDEIREDNMRLPMSPHPPNERLV